MMKKLLITISIIVLFIFSSFSQATDNTWQLIEDENGIQVYILEASSSSIVKAKTRTIVKASLEDVKKTLDDIEHRHEWVPFLKKSKALTQYADKQRIEHSHFSAPWPASDRDFVYKIELASASNQQLVYKMQSVESVFMPVDEDMIRADLYESIYTLTVIDKSTTEVELTFHADPKGWLPNWIINIIQRVLPYKILNNLKARLEK